MPLNLYLVRQNGLSAPNELVAYVVAAIKEGDAITHLPSCVKPDINVEFLGICANTNIKKDEIVLAEYLTP